MAAFAPLPKLNTDYQTPDPLEQYGRLMQIRNMMGQQQMQQGQQELQQQQIQQNQQQINDRQKMMQFFANDKTDWSDPANLPKLVPTLAQQGVSPQTGMQIQNGLIEQRKNLATLDETTLKNQQTRIDSTYQQLKGIIGTADPDQKQQMWQAAVQQHTQDGVIKPGQIPMQYPGDAQAQSLAAGLGISSAMVTAEARQRQAATGEQKQTNEAPGQVARSTQLQMQTASAQLAMSANQADYQAKLDQLPFGIAKAFPAQFNRQAVLNAGMTPDQVATTGEGALTSANGRQLLVNKTTGQTIKDLGTATPVMTMNMMAPRLTGDALDESAERFYQTGQLPNLGRMGGQAGSQIINRAAELHPGANLAANSAEYKANSDSLKSLQKNFDQVSAFEATAQKNIDLLQNTAKNIPDLGARFANVPVRMITGNMIGSANMASFKTALNTAQTEAAKVLNSSSASGVLSDSARHELQSIVDGNMPYNSMVASLNTLRQDMANRHQSYQEQISAIQGRLGTQPNNGGGASGSGGQNGAAGNSQSNGVGNGFNWNSHPKVQ